MGLAKQEMMRYEDERWSPTHSNRKVCKNCFDDEGIKRFIGANSTSIGCDFCTDKGSTKRSGADIDDVIEFIAECINREYGDPGGILPWDPEEKCYVGDFEIQSTESLLGDLILSKHEEVIELIRSAFDSSADWVHVHALRDSPGKKMTSLWARFAEVVKHERRFFFPRAKKSRVAKILTNGASSPADILVAITHFSKSLNLFRYLERDRPIFRARRYFKSEKPPFDLRNFGVPDRELSKKYSNRMSPAGIPIFYGSEGRKTAAAEVLSANGDSTTTVSFRTNRRLLILDLTLIPSPPSLFQENSWELREAILFLNQFRKEIMQPVKRNGHEHVEYIPSQIFTEFVRCRVTLNGKKIDGVAFPSIHNPAKSNIALFCDNSQILNKGEFGVTHFLRYVGPEKKSSK